MVTVNELKAYGEKLKGLNLGINHVKTIIDDSQLLKDLEGIYKESNHMLYLLIPESANQGADDSVVRGVKMQFIVLNKTDDAISHDHFLTIMNETQATATAIEAQLFLDRETDQENACGFMRWLDEASILMSPVWDLAHCHGWTITFSMRTQL